MYLSTFPLSEYCFNDDIVVENNDEDYVCLICWMPSETNNSITILSEFSHIITLCKCKSKFHSDCLNIWIAKSHSCPICRKKIRIKKDNKERKKYIGINADLEDFLIELGMNEKIGNDEYILSPKRDRSTKTMMNDLSRGFTHYKNGAGIKKDISLSNLRKTYLTWHHQILGDDTGLVSSHSTTHVLDKYYLDPKVLTAVEISALKVRVFGKIEKS